MEGDEPKSMLNEYSERVAENVVGFQQFIDEVSEALEQDENFNEMTAESYEQKKSYIKSLLSELSLIHNLMADQFGDLIEEVSKHCPALVQNQHLESSDSTSPQVTQTLAPKFTTATNFDLLLKPDGGGFYLSKCKGSSHSGSESSISSVNKPAVPPVNEDALKVKETKDSGSESSIPSVNKPPVSPASDDAKDHEALLEKISNLEQEVASLKQKLESLTDENRDLKTEIEENVEDMKLYMSKSKLEYKTMEEGFNASREIVKKIDEQMSGVVVEKVASKAKYESEIAQLKATLQKKEKICSGVIGQLKQELEEKSELVDELSKHMNILSADKSSQNSLIHQLKTELNSLKFENAGVLPSFDDVQKLTEELKQKVVELEREVERQGEAMSSRE